MAQNRHNAVIHLGHQNGTVTLWTPNLPYPAVRLLAHLGPVGSVSIDPNSGGRYMATAGQDGLVKVWDCRNWKGAVRQWVARGGSAEVEWSQKGSLAVATGGTVNVTIMSHLPNLISLICSDLGVHTTLYPEHVFRNDESTIVHDTSGSSPSLEIHPFLSIPGCPYHRALRWII